MAESIRFFILVCVTFINYQLYLFTYICLDQDEQTMCPESGAVGSCVMGKGHMHLRRITPGAFIYSFNIIGHFSNHSQLLIQLDFN